MTNVVFPSDRCPHELGPTNPAAKLCPPLRRISFFKVEHPCSPAFRPMRIVHAPPQSRLIVHGCFVLAPRLELCRPFNTHRLVQRFSPIHF
jgi:hypothetical protein